MEGVKGKYYVSTKGIQVLKAYVHKRAREGETFTGNFKDIYEYSHIQYQIIKHINFKGK